MAHSLAALQSLCQQNLHTGILSLKQLAPVHRTLFQSSIDAPSTIDCSFIQIPTSLEPVIQLLCNEEDKAICRRSLEPEASDFERLLMVQFLTSSLSFKDSVRCVLIPYLVGNPDTSEDLAVTLLDLLDKSIDGTKDLPELISALKNTNVMSGRILVKLLNCTSTSKELIQAFHEKLIQTMDEAISSPSQNNAVISTLSKDLLPVLTQSSEDDTPLLWTELHRGHTRQLWNHLFSMDYSSSDDPRSILLVVTTVLCPLLSHLVSFDLPSIGDSNIGSGGKPVEQPKLWHLIYTCLGQGKSLLESGTAMASILRKRALYLLNIVAPDSDVWKKYCICVETMEMETEQHLVDQIWDTVDELIELVEETPSKECGVLTWKWMSLLFSRVLSTDQTTIRKLGLYRLLKVPSEQEVAAASQKRTGKKKTHHVQTRASSLRRSLLNMPPEFVLKILLPSFNSLRNSVGYNMHLETSSRKVEKDDIIPLMTSWLYSYVGHLEGTEAEVFWAGIWSWSLVKKLHIKNVVVIYKTLSEKLSSSDIIIPADNEALQSLEETIHSQFSDGACVLAYQKDLLFAMATMLSHSKAPNDKTRGWAPMTLLKLLSLFSADYFSLDEENWKFEDEQLLVELGTWVSSLAQDAATVGAAVAAAFVQGDLVAYDVYWDPTIGATASDRDLAWAIAVLCTLATKKSNSPTTGQLLWPAVNKGLASATGVTLVGNQGMACKVTRALLLLEYGCRLREISGMGHGDLIADRSTQQLMPPPPAIEKVLSSGVDFILYHMRTLLSAETLYEPDEPIKPKRVLTTYIGLISQIRVLHQSYPSSNTISNAVEDLFKSALETLEKGADSDMQRTMLAALIYASVSSGVDPGPDKHIPVCRLLLTLQLSADAAGDWTYISRAVMQYAKWASISCILPTLISSFEEEPQLRYKEAEELFQELLAAAFSAIDATPTYACLPLFNCILCTAKQWVKTSRGGDEEGEQFYVENLQKIINGLLELMRKSHTSQETMDMLNEICALVFQPKLLAEESSRLQRHSSCATPIRDAFRKLVKLAGYQRPHILKAALCRITAAWLGGGSKSSLGMNAIPYREDIVTLLLYKELKIEESAKNQSRIFGMDGATEIPSHTNELSVTRAFILVFLSRLPDTKEGLHNKVLTELLHFVIRKLLVETAPTKSSAKSLIMKGTSAYCLKMRGWQALCNLSRFVTDDIATYVSESVFGMMPEHIHGQVRYFIEIFTIQCARDHPGVFGSAFLREISRRDLTLQHVSSLMIVAGNWIVGHYKNDYFDLHSGNAVRLKQLLAAVIPWLSSTQGFSRAIAQLLVHRLTPLCVDVNNMDEISPNEIDWFPRVIYRFLDENLEMKRLRKKQGSFFARYSVEAMFTPEGVLSIPVDEGDEANPVHMVDAMKEILKNIYSETHGPDVPAWKQIEQMAKSEHGNDQSAVKEVNFQRKIIPLDSLNLAMEDLRQKRVRNAAGQKKQQLIVCASLIDKVPNLGGLARTAEIFAADRLVIPDMALAKMDNFKSLSVGAGDWIEMEEVRQENLLSWLLAQKAKGYFVFGLEQTSSSISLTEMDFPDRPTVLLLGKEKEGIPVEYLQAVDQCVEIPQLGIIRSLNVHVSGAIAIWEHTKQRRLQSK